MEKRVNFQNQFSSWPQTFPNYFNSLLKNGLPPVLNAGSSGKYKKMYIKSKLNKEIHKKVLFFG